MRSDEPPEVDDHRPDVGRLPVGHPHDVPVTLRFQKRVEQVDVLLGKHFSRRGLGAVPREDGHVGDMSAETADGKATDAGWREAACGVVAFVDAQGNTLESRYVGRLPEAGKTSLKLQLKAEAFHWLDRNPDLKLAVVADGAKDNWPFLDSLCPDVTLMDFGTRLST